MKDHRNDELIRYKDAVWQYMLEHSDITDRGAIFIKFHTTSRHVFEGHVNARLNGYAREDTRLKLNAKEKERLAERRRVEHERIKGLKEEQYRVRRKVGKTTYTLTLEEQRRRIRQMRRYRIWKPRVLINSLREIIVAWWRSQW
jgi:hypothetical protein